MTEFHDDDVVWLYEVDDLVEAAFYGVGTGAAATDGFVDDWGVWGEEGGDVGAPAWRGGC